MIFEPERIFGEADRWLGGIIFSSATRSANDQFPRVSAYHWGRIVEVWRLEIGDWRHSGLVGGEVTLK